MLASWEDYGINVKEHDLIQDNNNNVYQVIRFDETQLQDSKLWLFECVVINIRNKVDKIRINKDNFVGNYTVIGNSDKAIY